MATFFWTATTSLLLCSVPVLSNPLPLAPERSTFLNDTNQFYSFETIISQANVILKHFHPTAAIIVVHAKSDTGKLMTGPRDATSYTLGALDQDNEAFEMMKSKPGVTWSNPKVRQPAQWASRAPVGWTDYPYKFRDAYSIIQQGGYGSQWQTVTLLAFRNPPAHFGAPQTYYAFLRTKGTPRACDYVYVGAIRGNIITCMPPPLDFSNVTLSTAQGSQNGAAVGAS